MGMKKIQLKKNHPNSVKLIIISLMVLFLMFLFTPPGIAGQNSAEESRLAGTTWDVLIWTRVHNEWAEGSVEFWEGGGVGIRWDEGHEGLPMQYKEVPSTDETVRFILWLEDTIGQEKTMIGKGTAKIDSDIRMIIFSDVYGEEYKRLQYIIYGEPFVGTEE
jgi:hypothetical protein